MLRSAARVVVVSRCVRGIDARGLHKTNLAALRDALRGVTNGVVGECFACVDGFSVPSSSAPARDRRRRRHQRGDRGRVDRREGHARPLHAPRRRAEHPGWSFAEHVGYSTPVHREAILRQGVSPLHRMSFQSLAYQQLGALECDAHQAASMWSRRRSRSLLSTITPTASKRIVCAVGLTLLRSHSQATARCRSRARWRGQQPARGSAGQGGAGLLPRAHAAGLDLGEHERAAVEGDQVDLAVARAHVAVDHRENPSRRKWASASSSPRRPSARRGVAARGPAPTRAARFARGSSGRMIGTLERAM